MTIHLHSVRAFRILTLGALCSCLPVGGANAEGPSRLPDLRNVQFNRIGMADGLASSTVTAVVEDREGVVWMGTESGLCRFDGAEIRVVPSDHARFDSLSSDHISAMTLGPDGKLWVGTRNAGLNRFDPVTESNERFQGTEPLPGQEIVSLAPDASGNLWVGTSEGLARVRLHDGRVTVFEGGVAGARVNALRAGHGGVWVGMLDGRLFFWNPEELRLRLRWRSSTPISALTIDQHDALWVGTQGTGLFRLRAGQPQARPEPAARVGIKPSEVPGKSITGLHCDRQGHLWVATPMGLCRLDRSTRRSTGRIRWIREASQAP